MITLVDCYTDEPAGLGVPPYLGTYPRYIYGSLAGEAGYITIDDLRYLHYYGMDAKKKEIGHKTNIRIYNLTNQDIRDILRKTSKLIIILGVHTPGKYLSAVPGTLKEIMEITGDIDCEKVLAGPAVYGTQLEGGKFAEHVDVDTKRFDFSYDQIREYSVKGAELIKKIAGTRIIEIETGHGCSRKQGCSFCTEPLKHKLEFRAKADIVNEVKRFYGLGCRYFRLGKQSCFYSHPEAELILKEVRKACEGIEVLHIDNVNPVRVISEQGKRITRSIVKYCTSGNVAAFGVESFDPEVYKQNNLNCKADDAMEAIRILNKYGAEKGENGMPKFLPGINLLFGLKGESKNTHSHNMGFLRKILKEGLLLRRINIRQVSIFRGTELFRTAKNRFIRKNKKYYWKWRNDIRQDIDFNMLKKLVPYGSVLKKVRMEIYDGNTTFGRQLGTYPLIVGVRQRLELGKFYDIRIKEHMLRSVAGEPIKKFI